MRAELKIYNDDNDLVHCHRILLLTHAGTRWPSDFWLKDGEYYVIGYDLHFDRLPISSLASP